MNETTVALSFVLGVLVIAALSSRRVAVAASLIAFVCYNFFFLPPVGTFAIAQKDDLVALFGLLAVSLIGSHLSQQARHRAEEALMLAQQRNEAEIVRRNAEAKSALISSLSHDLKTPLTALTVAAGNLSLTGLSANERHEQGQIVETELNRLKRLFDNVAAMASVEAKVMTAELDWVPAGDIIEAACHQVETVLAGRRIEINDATTDRLVCLDPRLTSAALGHVLENAAAYAPAPSPITVDVNLDAGRLVIAVRDRGPGVAHDELDRIFERFYRGSQTSQARFSSGMGLAITRGLLSIQAGRISAANHPSGGAVFTIEIPCESRVASEVALDVA